jgi:hypothetical protein
MTNLNMNLTSRMLLRILPNSPALLLNWSMSTVLSVGAFAGVLSGFSFGTAHFSSSASQIPEISTAFPESNVKTFKGTVPRKGGWNEAFITHPHDGNFWTELEELLRSLTSGENYAILLQPQFESGMRKTLGGSFHTNNNPNMQILIEHFNPIITDHENDYNEEFCIDTRVEILNISEGSSPPASKHVNNANAVLEAMQAQTNAILQSNAQILEAIKVQSTSPLAGLNWTNIAQGGHHHDCPSFRVNHSPNFWVAAYCTKPRSVCI